MTIRIIAVILTLASWSSGADPLPNKPHVYVEGSASIEVVPDTITFTVSLEKISENIGEAKSDLDSRSLKLIDVCLQAGVEKGSISTTTLSIRPHKEYKDGHSISKGTKVSRQVDIKLKNLELYPQIMAALIDLNSSYKCITS